MEVGSVEKDIEVISCDLVFDGSGTSLMFSKRGVVERAFSSGMDPAYMLDLAALGPDGRPWDCSSKESQRKCSSYVC